MRRIPVLSLWRPWPALIFHAGKRVENRSWFTMHRGPLLLHAAVGVDPAAMSFARDLAELERRQGTGAEPSRIDLSKVPADPHDHPTGIVGVVDLRDVCRHAYDNPGKDCACRWWANFKHMHWLFDDVAEFPEPVPHSGKQRLWAVSEDVWPAVEAQLKAVGYTG